MTKLLNLSYQYLSLCRALEKQTKAYVRVMRVRLVALWIKALWKTYACPTYFLFTSLHFKIRWW